MKVGDLVKHPDGIKNICPTTYSLGVVLDVFHHKIWVLQVSVHWLSGHQTKHTYICKHLEVIREGR